ncbi:MAG: hypothetical protein KKI09_04925 [Spirochaetes bacterium]|nr:hypothetical protein [Spirochaetota bacterium]MBU0954755.1 hypothetical protein [Spirochaetota bacterium]
MTGRSGFGPAYRPLLVLTTLFSLAALAALLPWPWASWPNIMGYRSLCTFAPGASFACALLAGITCTLRARLVRHRPGPIFIPVAVLGLLLVGLAVSTVVWAGVKAQYVRPSSAAGIPADAASGASAAE